jgi:hypothetical protein
MNQTQEYIVQPSGGVSLSSFKRKTKEDKFEVNANKSHLTKEIEGIPLYHLKRLFKGKLAEYNMYKLQNKIRDFNADTIFRADVNESYKR